LTHFYCENTALRLQQKSITNMNASRGKNTTATAEAAAPVSLPLKPIALIVALALFVCLIPMAWIDVSTNGSSLSITRDTPSDVAAADQAATDHPFAFLLDRDAFVNQHFVGSFLLRLTVLPNTLACAAFLLGWEVFEELTVATFRLMVVNKGPLTDGGSDGSAASWMASWMYESETSKLLGDVYSDTLGVLLALFLLHVNEWLRHGIKVRQIVVWRDGWSRFKEERKRIATLCALAFGGYVCACMTGCLAALQISLPHTYDIPSSFTLGGKVAATVGTIPIGQVVQPLLFAVVVAALCSLYRAFYARSVLDMQLSCDTALLREAPRERLFADMVEMYETVTAWTVVAVGVSGLCGALMWSPQYFSMSLSFFLLVFLMAVFGRRGKDPSMHRYDEHRHHHHHHAKL
jgi:hypothetical protein